MLTGYGDYGRVVWKVVFFGLAGQSLFSAERRNGCRLSGTGGFSMTRFVFALGGRDRIGTLDGCVLFPIQSILSHPVSANNERLFFFQKSKSPTEMITFIVS